MVSQVCRVMEKDMERHEKLVSGLRYIKREMQLVDALIKDDKECRGGAVQEIRIQQLQEFAYDVQDFVDVLWEPGTYGRRVLVTIGMDPRLQKLRTIEEFKERIVSLADKWQKQSAESIQNQQGEEDDVPEPDPNPDGGGEGVEQLVGIDGHKSKIVELLMPSPAELRVISIVGCRGVGKTAVAKAVYHECCSNSSSHDFDCVAWVMASGCNSKKTLQDKILQSVLADLASRASDAQAVAPQVANPQLHDILSKKRYLHFVLYVSTV
jgi:disease resistance protein RPM1